MKIEITLNKQQIEEIVNKVLLIMPQEDKEKTKEEMREKVSLLHNRGLSTREIGKILNVSRQTAWNYANKTNK